MSDWFEPYRPHPMDTWGPPASPLSAVKLGDVGERYLIPRGEEDFERLAPIRARLDGLHDSPGVEMVRVVLWRGDAPMGRKLTALYFVLRCIASHPSEATHVTLQGLGDLSA